MERAAGLAHGDTAQVKLDKLDAVLAETSTRIEDVAIFAEMLSLPIDGRYSAIALTPEQRRQRTLEALTKQLAGLASQNPVLMIFEDAHWVDPTSLEVFGRTVDQIKTLPVLLIVTFRPELARAAGWGAGAACEPLLGRLKQSVVPTTGVPRREAGMSPKKTSRFSGVTKRYDKWGAQIMQHLGAFAFEADAAIAVNYHVAYLGLDRPLNQVPLEEYAHD